LYTARAVGDDDRIATCSHGSSSSLNDVHLACVPERAKSATLASAWQPVETGSIAVADTAWSISFTNRAA
jgi:hypothetical protein